MINHISIAVNEPEKVANVLAEIWDGMVFPFPPTPGSFFVLANDGKGTAVEVLPNGVVLTPGEGLPADDDLAAETSANEAQFVQSEIKPRYVATHLNISTKKSIDELRELGRRQGWRTFVANRDHGLFQLVELWLEDGFLLEIMTPEQTERYVEITDPAFLTEAFAQIGNAPMPPAAMDLPSAAAHDLIG